MIVKHILETIPKIFGYRLVRKNYVSRMEIPDPRPKLDEVSPKKKFVTHQKREKWGTKEYKNGSMYLYCFPEDKQLIKKLASEQGISMKDVVRNILAEYAPPQGTDEKPMTKEEMVAMVEEHNKLHPESPMKITTFGKEFGDLFGMMDKIKKDD